MITENLTRKVDSMGRLSIPKHLRDKFDLTEGKEVEIFTHEDNGSLFICLKTDKKAKSDVETAIEMLAKAGYTVSKDE